MHAHPSSPPPTWRPTHLHTPLCQHAAGQQRLQPRVHPHKLVGQVAGGHGHHACLGQLRTQLGRRGVQPRAQPQAVVGPPAVGTCAASGAGQSGPRRPAGYVAWQWLSSPSSQQQQVGCPWGQRRLYCAAGKRHMWAVRGGCGRDCSRVVPLEQAERLVGPQLPQPALH